MSSQPDSNRVDAGRWRALRTAVVRALERLLPSGFRRTPVRHSAAFTSAFIALAAKMAKADGVVVHAEAEAFERFLEVEPDERANVHRLFELAKQDTAGYEIYAERIGRLMRDEPDLRRCVLESLICVACSDGILHPGEDRFLRTVAEKFDFTAEEYRHIRALFVRDAEDPYEVLELDRGASDAEVKARYRKLAGELHPDRLAAQGAEAAIIKAATAKLATINAAYEDILGQRARQRQRR
jgi:DnaJ like chaperone protein